MEGMYLGGSDPHIILSSLRPPGRRAFTCAHELGHHIRNDGTHLDELVEQRRRPRFEIREFAADCFAGALLMPKIAVERAFAIRGWKISTCEPHQVYVIADYFGVGYTTLIHHLTRSLRLLPMRRAEKLLGIAPRQAQAMAIGCEVPNKVWVVDNHWTGRPVDVEVGDMISVDHGTRVEGRSIKPVTNTHECKLLRATQPGIGRLDANTNWSAFIRVSRQAFVGRSIYRHREHTHDE